VDVNEGRFNAGEVWEMSYEGDPDVLVFLLLDINDVDKSFWNVLILESGPIFSTVPGKKTFMSLRDVSFYHGDVGYDSYDNMYTRLA
jgi:hypothetical protein